MNLFASILFHQHKGIKGRSVFKPIAIALLALIAFVGVDGNVVGAWINSVRDAVQ